MLNVTAHDGTIEKRLNKYGLSGKVARTKHLLSKKKMAAWLRVAKLHPNKPHNFWRNVLWTEHTKVDMFNNNTHCYIWEIYLSVHQIKLGQKPGLATGKSSQASKHIFKRTAEKNPVRAQPDWMLWWDLKRKVTKTVRKNGLKFLHNNVTDC